MPKTGDKGRMDDREGYEGRREGNQVEKEVRQEGKT